MLEEGWEINREESGGEYDRVQRMKEELFTLGTGTLEGNPPEWADFGAGPKINEDGNVEILAITHAGFLAAVEGVEGQCFYHTEEYEILTVR